MCYTCAFTRQQSLCGMYVKGGCTRAHVQLLLTDYTRLYRIRYMHARVLKGDCIEFTTATRAYSLSTQVHSQWSWLPACGYYAVVMNIVILTLTIMAIDPGTRTVRFLPLSLEI